MWPKPGLIDLPEAELAAVTSPAKTPTPPEIVVQGSAAVPVGAQGAEELLPPGGIRFRQTGLQMVLDIYADLAQARLEIDPRVRALNARISLETTQALSRADAVRLLERAINEQAGVAFKRSQKDGIEVTLEEGAKTNTNREH